MVLYISINQPPRGILELIAYAQNSSLNTNAYVPSGAVEFVFGLSIMRIYLECEGRIEKSVPRIAVWHHEACRVMTNGDPQGRIFLFYSHPNNELFFLLTTRFHILFLRKGSQKFLNTPRCDMS